MSNRGVPTHPMSAAVEPPPTVPTAPNAPLPHAENPAMIVPLHPHAPRRAHATLVRFGTAEREIVRARAHEAGRPVACFIREQAIGNPVASRPRPVHDAAIREMTELANILAILSRDAQHQSPEIRPRLDAVRAALVALVQRLGQAPNS